MISGGSVWWGWVAVCNLGFLCPHFIWSRELRSFAIGSVSRVCRPEAGIEA